MLLMRSSCCVLACCVLLALLAPAAAYPSQPNYYQLDESQLEPEEIVDMINRLGNMLQVERGKSASPYGPIDNTKRGLDLGLSRGYSGALQAKHLMGIAAANFAAGPGRRRRDLADQ